jgi:hypothetical protein
VKTILKDSVPAKQILGFTTKWGNDTQDQLFFLKNSNVDIDGRAPLYSTLPDGQLAADFAFDFQQRVITIHKIKFYDAFAVMGGTLAALKPIFGLATPFFIWYFLLIVSKAIKDNHSKAYRDGLNCIFGKSIA